MEASVRTFLASIARNYWFNELKKRDRSDHRNKIFELARGKDEADTSELIVEMEKKRQLRELVDGLGEPCRKILLMFYYENMSMREMAEHLPYENEQVIRNKKYKCLQQLMGFIKDNPALARQLQETLK
jgi:RNA polymerase sigma factor (sigma-70 family)